MLNRYLKCYCRMTNIVYSKLGDFVTQIFLSGKCLSGAQTSS